MDDFSEKPPESPKKHEKIISWVLVGAGVLLFIIGIAGYFLQETPSLNPEPPPPTVPVAGDGSVEPVYPRSPLILITIAGLRSDIMKEIAKDPSLAPNIKKYSGTTSHFSNVVAASSSNVSATVSLLTGVFPSVHQFYWMPWFTKKGKQIPENATTVFPSEVKNLAQWMPHFTSKAWISNWKLARSSSLKEKFQYVYAKSSQPDLAQKDILQPVQLDLVKDFLGHFERDNQPLQFYWLHFDGLEQPLEVKSHYIKNLKNKPTDSQIRSYKFMMDLASRAPTDEKAAETLKELYRAAIRTLDEHLGVMIERMQNQPKMRNTTIVISGTASEPLGQEKKWGLGAGLGSASVSVPVWIYLPEQVVATENKERISANGVPATIIELAGYLLPKQFSHGSLLPIRKAGRLSKPVISEMYLISKRIFAIEDGAKKIECEQPFYPEKNTPIVPVCYQIEGGKRLGWEVLNKDQQQDIVRLKDLAMLVLNGNQYPFWVEDKIK